MSKIIQEVTQLYPVEVDDVFIPKTIQEIQSFIMKSQGKISIGGGRYSMGGQTAIQNGVQIDMRQMNRVVHLDTKKKQITVEVGITWRDIQDFIDPHDLSIMTMQTYSNFTVWGSLSVNVHGRYIGYGPLILSIRSLKIILADGSVVIASREENADIFFGAIGGYGGIGVIVEATLSLRDNIMLERVYDDMNVESYGDWFRENIRDNKEVIFHNADIYPPYYKEIRATSWKKTDKNPSTYDRMIPRWLPYSLHKKVYHMMTYFRNPFTHTDYGKWARQHLLDPLVYRKPEIHSRNYEASYDVAELEPKNREKNSYVLEEYFCPVARINEFLPLMREIFARHEVNVINISIRHALPDDGSLLAWAREEVFAFVVYYNQWTSIESRREVAVWTRELIDTIISLWGRYYLPYQLHATKEQFVSAYPLWNQYVELKQKYDPKGRFSNMLLEKYYFSDVKIPVRLPSNFKTIYDTDIWRDRFYIFLQNIFHIAPTHLFYSQIQDIVSSEKDDESIYLRIQKSLPALRPFLSDIRYGLPALWKQKKEMLRQTLSLLDTSRSYDGHIEIGWAGRYIKPLHQSLHFSGNIYLLSDEPIDHNPVRILERGKYALYDTKLLTYNASDFSHIPSASVDIITIYIWLHHIPPSGLMDFLWELSRVLRSGGGIILRDHEVWTDVMHAFVSLAHDIYNAGTGTAWSQNQSEIRNFHTLHYWSELLQSAAFTDTGARLLQKNDPTKNTLMYFLKK